MPNHVINHLAIIGSEEQVADVKQFLLDKNEGDRLVCLDNIDACPKEYLNDDRWYSWRINHWGTKWDTYENEDLGDGTIKFETAWSTPALAMLSLSLIFPSVEFEIVFADEDAGYNCGAYTVFNGEFFDEYRPEGGSDDAMEYYFKTHPWNEEYFRKNESTGKWEYVWE